MSGRDGAAEAVSGEDTKPVSVQRLSMPIEWVVTLVGVVAAGALSLSLIYARAEAHAADKTRHLEPEVAAEGGVVTRKSLRKVLRKMTITCRPGPAGELTCTTAVPEEAE